MKFIQTLKNYFGFSTSESRGFVVLVTLLILFLAFPFLFDLYPDSIADTRQRDQKTLDTLLARMEVKNRSASSRHEEYEERPRQQKGRLVPFDPNRITGKQWEDLGVPHWLAERILKYRAHGGVFREKEDLKRIYDFPEETYLRLEPFIGLHETPTSGKQTSFAPVDLNEADTLALQKLPGIGPKLAGRIIKFRESLGGFHSPVQLYEVWGLDSMLVKQLQAQVTVTGQDRLRKIPINEVAYLKHPYVRPSIARAILSYREQHGPFQSVEDLKNIRLLDEETRLKLEPYLAFR
ncbi:ComEA family DNA-binding protein [Siphonobacter aquaeclarae]|uniref:DNA uptake protein ComE n=1 Tax=Siphonobacter aquaeclarae TaxID=563176 RepID=A0A1G9LBY8_9BACT|nr:helix-hairpin-helix domain-containing protein [Siphonobacter aquaeclarae]SDL59257.1 DNA uptake protein ComE [Siphonobacter aquaeclarae]